MTRIVRRWLGGYEERIRFFLALLVFMLAAANTANFLLLRSAWLTLRDAVEESVDAHGRMASAALLERWQIPPGAGAGPPVVTPARLARIAESAGCLALSLTDAAGRIVLATDGSAGGTVDKDFPPGMSLTPPSPEGISFRPSRRILDRGAVMVRYEAVADPASGKVYLVKSVHDTGELDNTGRGYRMLIWAQTVAIVIVLITVLSFGKWIAQPYRMMAREAGAADLAGAQQDPEDLVATFRRVVAKIREQDEELQVLHREARAGGSSLVRFTQGAARGMASGLIAVDPQGRFSAANPAAGRILGWSSPPHPGSPLGAWAGEDSPLARLLRSALLGETSRAREEIEHPAPGGAGRRLRLGVTISPVLREDPEQGRSAGEGALEGALCLIADLTEVRELEQHVRRREQLAALGTVSAGIAHEVRNGLATILGFARLAERSGAEPAKEHAQAIAREVQALGATVEDFLRYARPSRLTLGAVPLKPMLEKVVEEAGHAGLLERMTVRLEGEDATIAGDEQALRQAFGNLVRNAAESADRPVLLAIIVRIEDAKGVVTLRDDGDGIPAEHLDQVFLPFFSTRGKGTGMGLALAQKTILDHEGTIEVTCPPGGGTEVRIELPAAG